MTAAQTKEHQEEKHTWIRKEKNKKSRKEGKNKEISKNKNVSYAIHFLSVRSELCTIRRTCVRLEPLFLPVDIQHTPCPC